MSEMPKSVENALERLEREKQRVLDTVPLMTKLEEILYREDLKPFVQYIDPGVGFDVTVGLLVETKDDLVKVLRELGRVGFSQSAPPFDHGQVRSYKLKESKDDSCPIHVNFAFKGTKCKYVTTGYRQVPIKELRCEETTENAQAQ